MWVVWIVLTLLLNLVAEKLSHQETQLRIFKKMQKAKKKLLNLSNLETNSNVIHI